MYVLPAPVDSQPSLLIIILSYISYDGWKWWHTFYLRQTLCSLKTNPADQFIGLFADGLGLQLSSDLRYATIATYNRT